MQTLLNKEPFDFQIQAIKEKARPICQLGLLLTGKNKNQIARQIKYVGI